MKEFTFLEMLIFVVAVLGFIIILRNRYKDLHKRG
jgi:competence protein ComGC